MKKVFNFIKEHPLLTLMYLLSVALLFVDYEAGGLVMAGVNVVPSGHPTAAPGAHGSQLPGNTQLPGEATTVANASETSDIIEADIDEEIVSIASDESVIDTIKRRVKRQVRVKSFEVDHYMIDEPRMRAFTNAEYKEINATRAEIPFSTTGERRIFQEYHTAICKGVDGYDPTGQIKTPGVDLMLFFVGKNTTSEAPIAIAVNGPKVNPTDEFCYVPSIPAGTEVILLSSAAYETQKFIAPSTIVPVPERMYLQKQICNSITSDYFKDQKKRIPFSENQIAEAYLRKFRLESCRTAWVGQPGKFKVQAMDSSLGLQWDYFSKGIRWQIKRQYDLPSGANISFKDLMTLSMVKFTGYNCSKKAIWLLGRNLMNDIQGMDFGLYKNITMKPGKNETFGYSCNQIFTAFGTIDLIHDPMLDALGYSKCGALLDEEGLVRYYMKDEETKTEAVHGEEAKREIVTTIDCLCLKGYSHIWVNGSSDEDDYGIIGKVQTSSTLPTEPKKNDVVLLTADVVENGKTVWCSGTLVVWDGSKWIDFDGSFII